MSLEINGYRRFKNKTKLNLDAKLVALVGANEAGKSSILKLLEHLNHTNAFVKAGGSQELTRGLNLENNSKVVIATYLIESGDLLSLKHIDNADKIRWLKVSKTVSGNRYYEAIPRPKRKLGKRKNTIALLQKSLSDLQNNVPQEDEVGYEEYQECIRLTQWLITLLDVEEEDLGSPVVESMRSLSKLLLSSGVAAEIERLQTVAKELDLLADDEVITPHQAALNALAGLIPKCLFFDDKSRILLPEYELTNIGEVVPQSLSNLLNLAKLNLSTLQQFINEEDHGQIETLIKNANSELKKVFSENWAQSTVSVRLRLSDTTLHILVGESDRPYVRIAERSDGLRQYVALISFVSAKESEPKPILLIDEAETHLHYDAQADLVQMFARQEIAEKIIYTTHSVGCLPEDLGSGVRLIEQQEAGTSRVQNWFWESDKPGFSPLLFGMGAQTLAFMPVRYALVTEGASDIILLPALFKEVINKEYLGFQIVPGLSESNRVMFSLLENGSPRTVYLTDADDGGKVLCSQLKSAGIQEERIFSLPDEKKEGLVLEDFVEQKAYLKAVNE